MSSLSFFLIKKSITTVIQFSCMSEKEIYQRAFYEREENEENFVGVNMTNHYELCFQKKKNE
jgi:hypothetical protein